MHEPSVAPWLDNELRNWGLWCRSGPWPHPLPPDHAESIESRYVDPSDRYRDGETPLRIGPNVRRAEIVQGVYRDRLSDLERWVLVWRYVRRVDDRAAIRKMRVTRRVHSTILLDAVGMVARALEANGKRAFKS